MFEMADSIEEARGIDFGESPTVIFVNRDDGVDVGEGGGELARWAVGDEDDETFRNCL
jgi:hypothetical protein